MELQQPRPSSAVTPPFSPSLEHQLRAASMDQNSAMDIDNVKSDYERTRRATSVLSGMSAEDMEAAETLNSLHAKFHSPPQAHVQAPPTHLQTTTSYEADQSEPLLSLLTSTHPLAASVINGSLSAYKGAQYYIPGAEWTERHVGLPLAGRLGRVTGVEGGLRWALQGRREPQHSGQTSQSRTPDVEKALGNATPGSQHRRSSEMSAEFLPAYNDGDRSPPYTEHQVAHQSRERQPPPGWRQQLVISTSGLGVAMSEESIRSLRYCLSWLRWANHRLDGAIESLRDLLRRWDEGVTPQGQRQTMSVATMTQSQEESRKQALSARIAALKADVLQTLKQVVGVVSNYAGGALPENARNLVHRHLTSLPQRFSIASAMSTSANESSNEAEGSAHRVMVLAQEGLDMMTQVTRVVNDTLTSAESWCKKLGRRVDDTEKAQHQSASERSERVDDGDRSMTAGREEDADVKMEM